MRDYLDRISILVITHPRRPKADRLPARHAHTCHAPSGFAAGASRPMPPPITRTTDDPISRSASLPLTASHPRIGAGNVSRPLLRCRSGNPCADCLSQGILCTKHNQVNIFNVLACHSPAFARLPGSHLDPRDNPPASAESRPPPRATRSHVPRSQRLRRRRFTPNAAAHH